MGESYDVDALAADVAADGPRLSGRPRSASRRSSRTLARWMERQDGLLSAGPAALRRQPRLRPPAPHRGRRLVLHHLRRLPARHQQRRPLPRRLGRHRRPRRRRRGDEVRSYRRSDRSSTPARSASSEKTGVYHFPPGSITHLLPPEEGFHRVRAAADVNGVSIHILGGTAETHPHFLCEPIHPQAGRLPDAHAPRHEHRRWEKEFASLRADGLRTPTLSTSATGSPYSTSVAPARTTGARQSSSSATTRASSVAGSFGDIWGGWLHVTDPLARGIPPRQWPRPQSDGDRGGKRPATPGAATPTWTRTASRRPISTGSSATKSSAGSRTHPWATNRSSSGSA